MNEFDSSKRRLIQSEKKVHLVQCYAGYWCADHWHLVHVIRLGQSFTFDSLTNRVQSCLPLSHSCLFIRSFSSADFFRFTAQELSTLLAKATLQIGEHHSSEAALQQRRAGSRFSMFFDADNTIIHSSRTNCWCGNGRSPPHTGYTPEPTEQCSPDRLLVNLKFHEHCDAARNIITVSRSMAGQESSNPDWRAKQSASIINTISDNTKRNASEMDELDSSLQSRQINPQAGQTLDNPAKWPKLLNNSGPTTMAGNKKADVGVSENSDDQFNKAIRHYAAGTKHLEKFQGARIQQMKQLQETEAAKTAEVAILETRVRDLKAAKLVQKPELETKLRDVEAANRVKVWELERKLRDAEAAKRPEMIRAFRDQNSARDARKAAQESNDALQKLKEAAREVTAELSGMTEEKFGVLGKKMDELRKLTK